MLTSRERPGPATRVSARVLARRAAALLLLSNGKTDAEATAEEASESPDEGAENAPTNSENNSESNPSLSSSIDTPAIGSGVNGYAGAVCARTRVAADIHFIITKVHNRKCSIKKAMLVAEFTRDESNSKTLQRRVIRFTEKLTTGPPPLISVTPVAAPGVTEKVSGLTSSENSSSLVVAINNGRKKRIVHTTGNEDTSVSTKMTRKTPKQVHAQMVHKQIDKKVRDMAYETIISKIKSRCAKNVSTGKSLSVVAIVADVNKLYSTDILPDTVRRRMRKGMTNVPLGNGRKPLLPPVIESALVEALGTYVNLACAEMEKQPARRDMIDKLSSCLENGPTAVSDYESLYKRLYKGFAKDVEVISGNSKIEERRAIWTTYNNINTWFNTLRYNLIHLGFARIKVETDVEEGELFFYPGQLNRIVNLDESGLTLDGNNSLSGGRSSTRFGPVNKLISSGCDRTNKSSCRITFIAGSTAAGHPLPPHFQLKSVADDENKKIQRSFIDGVPVVYGVYGLNKLTCNGITVNCNRTAGMDTVEFRKYLEDAICPLYPDASDVSGKRVLLILDSGPGRKNLQLLASLRARGIYVVAGVPNTTHVTQPTDQNYGYFKSIYRRNLKTLVEFRRSRNDKVRVSDIPLLVFGKSSNRRLNDAVELEHAFDRAFGVERSREVWRKIGISPFTRNCLQNSNVAHELIMLEDGTIDLEADPSTVALIDIERKNHAAVNALNEGGYDGDVFKKYAPRKKLQQVLVTTANTRARQDALSSVKYSSQHFILTNGDTLNSDDFFISEERQARQEKIKSLLELKKKSIAVSELNGRAMALIEEFNTKHGKDVYELEDAKLLPVTTLKVLCHWKLQKRASGIKEFLLNLWMEVKNKPLPSSCWSDDQDTLLKKLKEEDIELSETALGKERKKLHQQSVAYLLSMTEEEKAASNLPFEVLDGLKRTVAEV